MISALRRYAGTFTGFERDARVFLVVTVVYGIGLSLYWVDFNLYLSSLGFDRSFIGLVATASSAAGLLGALPIAFVSDRVGRRRVLVGGAGLGALGIAGLLATAEPLLVILLAALLGLSSQVFNVVSAPFLTERSRPEHRNELFSLQFAITSLTNVVAALVGGALASAIAVTWGFAPDGPEAYRLLLVAMFASAAGSAAILLLLADDRPSRQRGDPAGTPGEPASGGPGPADPGRISRPKPAGAVSPPARLRPGGPGRARVDLGLFTRILLPGFLISLGAGQVIPFLNLFIQGKFGLDLAALNAVFAITSFGTFVAIMIQPALARRFGKIGSVVLVQAASLPFLAILGFSPVLWTVIVAMAVRNSLMNAGNPIFTAFAMERVRPAERATLAAAMSLVWSGGWALAGPWYSVLQRSLGFEAGYAVSFVTVIVLYSLGTFLTWHWFGAAERAAARPTGPEPAVAEAREADPGGAEPGAADPGGQAPGSTVG
ncbi:MAG: major facilitator superfamily 1 [Chloroflexi bacterium]|nr:major facilitator superfamily 1 [Chloroflexota bacterium]